MERTKFYLQVGGVAQWQNKAQHALGSNKKEKGGKRPRDEEEKGEGERRRMERKEEQKNSFLRGFHD